MPIKAYFTMLLSKTQQDFTLKIERLQAIYISYVYLHTDSSFTIKKRACPSRLDSAFGTSSIRNLSKRDTCA